MDVDMDLFINSSVDPVEMNHVRLREVFYRSGEGSLVCCAVCDWPDALLKPDGYRQTDEAVTLGFECGLGHTFQVVFAKRRHQTFVVAIKSDETQN
jgi:hypothetical protein